MNEINKLDKPIVNICDMTLSDFRAWLVLKGRPYPELSPIKIIPEKTDMLVQVYDQVPPSLGSMMAYGFSPIVFEVNEPWCPLLDRLSKLYDYVFKWVTRDDTPSSDTHSRRGIATLVKK